jgi:hypothetical protein
LEKLKIRLGAGNDRILFFGVAIDDLSLEIKDKLGDNSSAVVFSGGLKRVKIHHGPGADAVTIANTTRERDSVKTGGGNDMVRINGGASERTSLKTGNGDDQVTILGASLGRLRVKTEDGDDRVTLSGSVLEKASFDGGDGADCLVDDGTNAYGKPPKVKDFGAPAC